MPVFSDIHCKVSSDMIRDYHMGFSVIARSINPRHRYQLEGDGQKYYNLFITYSNPQFELFSLKTHHVSNQNKDDHVKRVTSRNTIRLTSC